MDIDPEDVAQNYYQKCETHLADVMRNEQRNHPAAQQQALEQYKKSICHFNFMQDIPKTRLTMLSFIL